LTLQLLPSEFPVEKVPVNAQLNALKLLLNRFISFEMQKNIIDEESFLSNYYEVEKSNLTAIGFANPN